jgi:hypothetical protein
VVLKQKDKIEILWDTAYAANAPLSHYEVLRDGKLVGKVKHEPQISRDPFTYLDVEKGNSYQVVVVDEDGNRAVAEPLQA